MMQSDDVKEVAAALSAAQAKIKAAAKDSTNPHFKSKYADLAAVWEACRDALTAEGLAVVQQPHAVDGAGERLRTVLYHKSGQWIASDCALLGGLTDMQKYGSALTYARRYGLAAMVGVVADEDDDGNAAARPAKAKREAEPATVDSARAADVKAVWSALLRVGAFVKDTPDDEKKRTAYRYCSWVLQRTVTSLSELKTAELTECASKIGGLTRKMTDAELLQEA